MARLFVFAALFHAHAATPCDKLHALKIPNVQIESASIVNDSCRVKAIARPVDDSEIRFDIWLPAAEKWNGKFLGNGNGGYSSSINTAQMNRAIELGYATAGTDTGHTGGDPVFAFGHPEKLKDFAYRAIHLMTTTAKHLIRVHYGRHAAQAYFSSCSTGGHQALSEVQRYPDDYDGVIAGAPANNRIGQTFAFLWGWLATHDDKGAPILAADHLKLVHKSVLAACDAQDGLKDGLIGEPRRCRFDPAALACKPGQSTECLTPSQVEAFRKVYAGVKNPRTGRQIFAGWPLGSEHFGDSPMQSWRAYLLDPKEPMRVEAFRYFIFNDPAWNFREIDWDRDHAFAEKQVPFLNANDTNLNAFKNSGGKLIMYAGLADPVVPPAENIAYFDAVTKAMGGPQKTAAFARLFLAPGMGHCQGGYGPSQFDSLTALDQWVTKGIAPEKLIATQSTVRTRPLCAYPQVARYSGKGSIDDAANFTCVTPAP